MKDAMLDGTVIATRRELLSFRAGNQEFCVDVTAVREIRGWTPETRLPHAPPFVRGVVNLRGAIIPVVDLARRLGLPPADPGPHSVIIVTQVGPQLVGLLVSAVCDIVSTEEGAIQPPPGLVAGSAC